MISGDTFVAVGERVLEDGSARARRIFPGLRLHTTLALGPAAAELLARCDPGNLLLIGRTGPVRSRGRLALTVAARARCPVRLVPDLAPAAEDADVVLAVGRLDGEDHLVEQAFVTAAATRSRLVVIHHWSLPSVYRHLLTDDDVRRWNRQEEERLHHMLEPFRSRHRSVAVAPEVVPGVPEQALLEAARSARLLLTARNHDPTGPIGHLGRVAHTLLVEAGCPVEVWPAVEAT